MRKICAVLLLITVIACRMPGMAPPPEKKPQGQENIVEALASAGHYIHFYAMLESADMLKTLEGQGPFTVFAPTDNAYAAFIPGAEDYLLNPDHLYHLQAVMKYHVVRGKLTPEMLKGTKKIKSMLGMDLTASHQNGELYIDKAHSQKKPIVCSNGLIYEIDQVLLPKH